MGKIAAIFDLDETLLDDASGRLFIKYLRQEKKLTEVIRLRDLPGLIAMITGFQMGIVSATRAAQHTASVLAGFQVDYFWQIVRAWFDEMLVHHINEGAKETVAWHIGQGHTMLVCSASPQFSVQPVTEYLRIPYYISTEWLSAGGRLTGNIRLPLAHGEGKVLYVKEWAEKLGINLDDSYFYSDHISDRPLLELVGNPVAVSPEPELLKLSNERGWRIDTW